MYVFQSAGQLSIEEFYVPFGGKLDPGNRWVVLANVIPWEPLENQYAPLFNAKTGAPAKPFRMALGALYIQQRLGVTDRETVELITESPYLQFFIGLSGFQYLKPFDSSMLVHFRKRIGPDLIKVCNDMTKANGIAMIKELLAASQERNTDAEQIEIEAIETELGVPAGVPRSGVISPAPHAGLASLGGASQATGSGWCCKRWAGPFPWFEYHLNQTNHAQDPLCRT